MTPNYKLQLLPKQYGYVDKLSMRITPFFLFSGPRGMNLQGLESLMISYTRAMLSWGASMAVWQQLDGRQQAESERANE